jgi:hypothetical protein
MRKVLIGCGIVAALLVAVLIVGGMMISTWFRSKFPEVERIETNQNAMRERFGDPERYTPPRDGSLPPERLEIFVALRESLSTRRDSAAVGLVRFVRETKRTRSEDRGRMEKVMDAVQMARGGAEMTAGILRYFGERQQMQLDRGMGDGEYTYWLALTTLAWLGWDPLANPEVEEVFQGSDMRSDAVERREELLRMFRRQLGNLRRDLEAAATRTPAEERTLKLIVAELDAERPAGDAPFQGSFPPEWVAALEPYRARLTSTLPSEPGAIFLDLLRPDSDSDHVRFDWNRSAGPHGER